MKLKIFVSLLTFLSYASSITIGRDGGYRNIVVKIGDNVPEDDCHKYIQNLKEMLTEASAVLNEGLERRVYFAQITLVLPSYWRDARCHMSVPYPASGVAYQVADILVTPDSPVFGSAPYTEQSGGCGSRGDRILIPQSFLGNWNTSLHTWGNSGKLFVKEWSKYRYGVFDEHGYPNDPLYPNFFKIQDKILPTGSYDTPVLGVWLHPNGSEGCSPASGSCYFNPEGENDAVQCSLGNMPFLPGVKSWCPTDDRMLMSPSKHNILCGARSAKTVILNNPDFAELSGENQLQRSLIPRFDIVREPLPKYVLIMETSSALADVWKWVRKSTQNLIRYEVPDNSNLAVVTFNSDSRVEHRMVQLTMESVRSRMADTIPDSPNKLDTSTEGCVTCGIQVAMEQVLKDNEAGGHLIIITKETENSLTNIQEQNIETVISNFGVRVSSIVLAGQRQNQFYETIAASSGGVYKRISGTSNLMEMYSDFIEAMRDVVAKDTKDPNNHPLTVYRQFIYRQDSEPTVGAFDIDATLGRQTEFGIYVEDDEDHQIKSVEFSDVDGNVYGPFSKMSSSFDVVNFKTINFNVGEEPPFDAKRGTRWEYKIEWYDINERRENVVTVRSRPSQPSETGLIHVSTWTNLEEPDNLLAVYVKVWRGDSPVLNARVLIDLQIEVDSEDILQDISEEQRTAFKDLLLTDNGFGEPDIVAGDGVYSRYITNYPTTGKYKYKVRVDDNNDLAMTVTPGPATVYKPPKVGINTCCGSRIPIPADRKEKIGLFRRTIDGPSITISNLSPSGDHIRPGKIGDLEIRVIEHQQLMARWTAPGDDFNDGEVMTYRFVFSQKIEELITPSTNAPALDGLKRNDTSGERVNHVINFEYYGQDYYVGLYASDEAGNKAVMSNIVLVNVPPPPAPTDDSGLILPSSNILEDTTDWAMVGGIIGGVAVLLLLLLLGLYFHFCRTRSKFSKAMFASGLKNSGVKVQIPSPPGSENTDSSSYESDMKGATSNHLVAGIQHPKISSTSFANNLTPTYWSASQLLSEHDARRRDEDEEVDGERGYPDVINYNPSNNYGGYYQEQFYDQYNTRRYSTASRDQGYQVYGGVGYRPEYGTTGYGNLDQENLGYGNLDQGYGNLDHGYGHQDTRDYIVDPGLNKSNQRLVNSDLSSSTLGITNPSLHGSQLSLSSSRLQAKNRNITQV